jgi:hypothetical protein
VRSPIRYARTSRGVSGKWGDEPGYDMTNLAVTGWGSRMGWVVRLIEMGTDKPARSVDVLEFGQFRDFGNIASLGLTLAEAKQLLYRVQQAVATAQAHDHAVLRPNCSSCGGSCHIKDWRQHQVGTLFGSVEVRLPRFRCVGCGHTETGVGWPSHCRSTPELDHLRAHLSALIPSVVSTHSWNLVFVAASAAGAYMLRMQEAFALDPRLHPPHM